MSDQPLDDKIRTVLTDALDAATAQGKPDHATRLKAVELLLRMQGAREATGEPVSATLVVRRDDLDLP